MDTSILKKLGLDDKESKAYIALLTHGNVSVRELARLTRLNRGTCYDILKRLQALGLATYFHRSSKQQFTAEPPERLLALLKEKQRELQSIEDRVAAAIPQFKSLMGKSGGEPVSKFYEGRSGIKLILEDVLTSLKKFETKEYYAFSAKHASEDLHGAYPNFTDDRIKQGIKVKVISLAPGGQPRGLDERRWLGTEDPSATFGIIYAGKCAFVARDSAGEPVGVVIENRLIYETQKMIFLRLWDLLG